MASAATDSIELFHVLDATNGADVEDIKKLMHENLNQTKDPSYLNSLVDYYMSCGSSTRCQDILVGIREPHDKHLFDKLNDCFKSSGTRFRALTLLGHIVYKQPSWLYKIAQHSLLNSLIKILKTDTDIPNVMSGCLIIVTLLPVIPSAIGAYLNDIFEAFTRISAWHAKRPASIPETIMMHLHVALYALFHRLYSMYPCNFLSYLRTYCNTNVRDHLYVFRETIKPMLDFVRMHPLLVTFSKDTEVSMTRWKKMETHDIVVECAKLSLDPIEGMSEVQNTFAALKSTVQKLRYSHDSGFFKYSQEPLVKMDVVDSIVGEAISDLREDWSPSFSCSLSTPPPFQPSALQDPFPDHNQSGSTRIRARTFSGSPTTYHSPVPHSPLRIDSSHFRFQIVEAVCEAEKGGDAAAAATHYYRPAVAAPTPLKLARVPLGKAAGLPTPGSSLARVTTPQRLDERHQFRVYEKDDPTDSEVASIIEGNNSSSNSSQPCSEQQQPQPPTQGGQPRDTPLSHRPLSFSRSGRGSAQWCQSPYLESLQDIQRKRSYSQGKKVPRRATIEVSLPRSTHRAYRSRSLPDLKQQQRQEAGSEPPQPPDPPFSSDRQPGFPYERLFSMALPKAAQESLCPKCQCAAAKTSSSSTHQQSSSVPLFVQMTPPEMLDRYMQLCDSVHTMNMDKAAKDGSGKEAQSKGKMEDPRILNGQLQLLHIQLLYERNKREIHAERNRRLLGKAKRVTALEEQTTAMKDQMQLLEKEIITLTENNTALRRDKQRALDQKDEETKLAKDELRSVTQKQLALEKSVSDLTKQLQEAVTGSELLKKEHQKAQADIFNLHHELQAIQEKVAQNVSLKSEVANLSRELLLTTEVNQKYQDKITALQNYQHYEVEMSTLRDTYTHEMRNLHTTLQGRDAQLETTKTRLAELEGLLVKKDIILTEQKRLMKASKEEYEHQIKAVEDKHTSRRLICQHLESEILKLCQKIEKLRAEGGPPQRGRADTQGKRKSSEKTETTTTTTTTTTTRTVDARRESAAKSGPPLLEDPPWLKDPPCEEMRSEVTSRNLLLPEITLFGGERRASEPIDIEPSFMGATGSSRRAKRTFERDSFDESWEMHSDFKEIIKEERISGALEPITPQSLASLIDIEEY